MFRYGNIVHQHALADTVNERTGGMVGEMDGPALLVSRYNRDDDCRL